MIKIETINSDARTIEIKDSETGETLTKGFTKEEWETKTKDELFGMAKEAYLDKRANDAKQVIFNKE